MFSDPRQPGDRLLPPRDKNPARALDGQRGLSNFFADERREGSSFRGRPRFRAPLRSSLLHEEMEMRTAYDLSPLYRSMIGVDRVEGLIDSAMRREGDQSYPPFDVEKTGEDSYRISLATAGFAPGDLTITAQPNLLLVAGTRRTSQDERQRTYLHRGIAVDRFERRFQLADHVVVKDASYDNGLLIIALAREVPEALKPRRVEIGVGPPAATVQRIETEAGAGLSSWEGDKRRRHHAAGNFGTGVQAVEWPETARSTHCPRARPAARRGFPRSPRRPEGSTPGSARQA